MKVIRSLLCGVSISRAVYFERLPTPRWSWSCYYHSVILSARREGPLGEGFVSLLPSNDMVAGNYGQSIPESKTRISLSSPHSWWKWCKIWSRLLNARRRKGSESRSETIILSSAPRLKTCKLLQVQFISGSRDAKAWLFLTIPFPRCNDALPAFITMLEGVIRTTYAIKVLSSSAVGSCG